MVAGNGETRRKSSTQKGGMGQIWGDMDVVCRGGGGIDDSEAEAARLMRRHALRAEAARLMRRHE